MAEALPNSNQKNESNSALGNIFSNQILSIQNKQKEVDNQNVTLIQQQENTLSLFNTSIQSLRTDIGKLSTGLSNIAFLLQKDGLEEQSRIRQQQQRERILAEQEVRIGKESELEQKIQSAVAEPVERLAPKVENTFSGIKNALGILFFGWLTNEVVGGITNSEEKTATKFNDIKFNIIKNIGIGIGGLTAIKTGFTAFKNAIRSITSGLSGLIPESLRNLISGDRDANPQPPPSQPPSAPSGQVAPPTGVTANQVSGITDTRNPSKVVIGAGHVDTPGQPGSGQGTTDPTTGVRESAATQHILGALQSLIGADPILKDRIQFSSFTDENFAKNNRDMYTNKGMQFLELHFDQYGGAGRSGLIPSRNAREGVTGNTGTSGFDVALSAAFGNFGKGFKEGDLGIPDTGGSILELGAIDSNKELLNEVKSGKIGPETTKMVQYLYQSLRKGAQLEGWTDPNSMQPAPSAPAPAATPSTSQISEERQKQFEMAWNYRNNPMARGRIEGAWNNLSAEEQQQAIQWSQSKGYNWEEMKLTPKSSPSQTQQSSQTIQPSPAQITTPPQPPQQVGNLPEPQPVITMISSPNANQQPAPPPITNGPMTDVPLIKSSNPDNFYVLYSQFNYNVVM